MTLLNAWLWIKKHWEILLLVVGAIGGALLFRKRETSFSDDYKKIQEIHEKELATIQKSRDDERQKLEDNQRKLQATLDAVQKKYDEQERQLDDKKKAEIADIVKQHGNDPVELARQVSSVTGFKVILPED